MNYKIYFILASLFIVGGNITSVLGGDDHDSSLPGKDILTELSAAGALVILILYIVFDFIKNKHKGDANEELSRIVVKGDTGTHSLVTQVALLQNDINDLKHMVSDLKQAIKDLDNYRTNRNNNHNNGGGSGGGKSQ